ncbi:MAG: dihydroorotase, partial [Chloroflexaceae bacterium]|nr:dihydroorotase [Chloroflexaceae bacterium]
MAELGELAPTVVGFSDGIPLENLGLLRQILDYSQPLGKPIACAGDR